jgi:hypothetical protein
MEFVGELVAAFLRLPETYNQLADERNAIDTSVQYQASVHAPFDGGHSDQDEIAGLHFELSVTCEPLFSESAAVTANTVSFLIADDRIRNAVFTRDDIDKREDVPLDRENCEALLAAVQHFCENSLPNEIPEPDLDFEEE